MLISRIIMLLILLMVKNINPENINKNTNTLSESEIKHYDFLFNSIQYDYYNLSLIYNNKLKNLNNFIKIKHKSNKDSFKNITCVFGVLCNDRGLDIENSMLKWLLPEYDVYCVYQKYPGIFFEYAALRFAQWISQIYNKSIILYLHTKGAFYPQNIKEDTRELWKHEFTKERKQIYIQLLKDNHSDISLPFTDGRYTWFNGMFISYRAFNLP